MAALKIHILLFHSETPAWIFFLQDHFCEEGAEKRGNVSLFYL